MSHVRKGRSYMCVCVEVYYLYTIHTVHLRLNHGEIITAYRTHLGDLLEDK
jgi:hypothetical protein